MTYRAMVVGTLVSAALVGLIAPVTAHAQDDRDRDQDESDQAKGGGYITRVGPRQHERILITAGAGFVPSIGRQFTDDSVGRLTNGRTSRVIVDYDLRHAIDIEAGAVVMLNRSWGVGLTLSRSRSEDVEALTTIGALSGQSQWDTGLLRKETAGRFELTRVLLRRDSWRHEYDPASRPGNGYIIRAFGGPAFYRAEQHIITLRTSEIDMHSGTGWGYHAGIDASMFTGLPGLDGGGFGVGGTLRYSGGSVRLAGLLDNGPSGRPAGGWNFAGGFRFRM